MTAATRVWIGMLLVLAATAASAQDETVAGKIAEARKIGLPTTPAEITPAAVPDDENGATIVLEVDSDIATQTDQHGRIVLIEKASMPKASESDRQLATVVLTGLKPEMEKMLSATQKPVCRFPIDWPHLHKMSFSFVFTIKDFVFAYCLKADQDDQKGDPKSALADITAANKIARLLAGNGQRTTSGAQLNCDSAVERALRRLFERHARDKDFLAAAKAVHAAFGPIPDYQASYRSEVVFDLTELDSAVSPEAFGLGRSVVSPEEYSKPISQTDRDALKVHVLSTYIAFFTDLPKGFYKWPVIIETARHAWEQFVPKEDEVSEGAFKVLNALYAAAPLTFEIAAYAMDEAQRRMTRTAIAVLEQMNQTGHLPDTIPDLGDDSTDPFNGHFLQYQRTDDGFTITCAGTENDEDFNLGKEHSMHIKL